VILDSDSESVIFTAVVPDSQPTTVACRRVVFPGLSRLHVVGSTMQPPCTLYYWPIPGRGVFVRALFAFTATPLREASSKEIMEIRNKPPTEQPVPLRAPPFLIDEAAEGGPFAISQLPAVCEYVASKLGLLPSSETDLRTRSLALKVLCDCNDVLGELWLHNGDVTKNGEYVMWDQKAYDEWRDGRFVGWLRQWEAHATRSGCTADSGYLLGTKRATLADLATWSLWATLARCVPQLSAPLHEHMPVVMALIPNSRTPKDK
jgi:glutathione S-transferase